MGPPLLTDKKANFAIAEMPIILYLGEILDFMPATPALRALTTKIVKARKDYGDAYCGGQIEVSLRKVLSA
jgi:glutathione S-transferase